MVDQTNDQSTGIYCIKENACSECKSPVEELAELNYRKGLESHEKDECRFLWNMLEGAQDFLTALVRNDIDAGTIRNEMRKRLSIILSSIEDCISPGV